MRRISISAPLHCWSVLVVAGGNCATVGNGLRQDVGCKWKSKWQVAAYFMLHSFLLNVVATLLQLNVAFIFRIKMAYLLLCCRMLHIQLAQAVERQTLSVLEEMLQLLWHKRLALPGCMSSHGCSSCCYCCCCHMAANENINAPSKQTKRECNCSSQ